MRAPASANAFENVRMTTTPSSISPTAASPAYSKYASSTASGRASGSGPSAPVGFPGRHANVSTGSSSPTSAPASCAATRKSGYVGAVGIATVSPGPGERARDEQDQVVRARAEHDVLRLDAGVLARSPRRSAGSRRADTRSRARARPRSRRAARTASGSGGTFPSKRTISTGSSPARRASSSVDGAHAYGANSGASALIAAPPPRARAGPRPRRAPRPSAARARALRRQPLDRDRLQERLEPEPADRARPAAGRQDVIRAGAEIAASATGELAPTKTAPALRTRGASASASPSRTRCSGAIASRLLERRRRRGRRPRARARPARRARARRCARSPPAPSTTTTSDGPAGRSIATSRDDRELRVVHVRAARARRSCPRARRMRGSAIACAPPSAHTSSIPSSSAARATRPAPSGGVQTTIAPHAGDLRRHGAHDERRDEPARHVDADRVERHPAPLELDAGLHLEPHVGRPLHLVPAAHAVGEREHRLLRKLAVRLGARRLDAVEAAAPTRAPRRRRAP